MKKKNILLIGRGTISVNCLTILEKNKLLPKVIICDVDDNGEDNWSKSLFSRAIKLGYVENVSLFRTRKINSGEFIEKLTKCGQIDIIFSVQPKALFKTAFINLAKDYVVNLHFAPLPKLRGVSTCAWAILDDLNKMGVTLHLIKDEGIDNGPIIFQKLFSIKKNDTTAGLYKKCIYAGTKLFKESLNFIVTNKINPKIQNEKLVTYHSKTELDLKNCEINSDDNFLTTIKFIRSRIFPQYQLPFFKTADKKVFISDFKVRNTGFNKKEIKKNGKVYEFYFPNKKIIITNFIEEKLPN